MKKLLTLTFTILLLTLPIGCNDDEDTTPCEPSCGIVDRHGFASNDDIAYYEIYVKNDCTKRVKAFRVSKTEYYTYEKGDFICTLDGSTWKEIPTKEETETQFKLN